MKNNKIMPVFCRHFLLSALFISAPIFLFTDYSIIEKIQEKYTFESIEFYFRKNIEDTLGIEIGNIYGKFVYNEDSIFLLYNTKNDARILKYQDSNLYEIENNKLKKKTKIDRIPVMLDIISLINPLKNIEKENIYVFENKIIIYKNDILTDSMIVFFNNELLDSLFFFKNERIVLKTYYSNYNNNFPSQIITFDFLNNTVEKIFHYKIKIDKY